MSRAAQLNCQHLRSCALVLTLFLFQKGQGFFPPLPIAALLPRSWRRSYLPPCRLGCFDVAGRFCGADKQADFLFPQWTAGILIPCRLGCFVVARLLCGTKMKTFVSYTVGLVPCGGMGFCCLADFGRPSASGFGGASHEACRRMAV